MSVRHGRHAPVVSTEANGGAGPLSEPLHLSLRSTSRRNWIALTLICLAIGSLTGAAAAYWNGHGAGWASAATGTMGTVSVTAFTGGDAPSTALLPGGSSDVVLRISNTNSYSVTLTAISLNGSITASGGVRTCSVSGVSTNFPSSPSITVPAGSNLIHLSSAAVMSAGSSSGCQGATFSIPITVTIQK
jgi:hypothetical protein